jgi:hypothetical protein
MPRDSKGRYINHGLTNGSTISRMTRVTFPRSRMSTRMYPQPYPTPDQIIDRVDAVGQGWYHDEANELHQRDFIWYARMQSARRMDERARRFPGRDKVLDRLMEEGIFDRTSPDVPNTAEEMAMSYAASMVQRLLMRIESLEAEVCGVFRE